MIAPRTPPLPGPGRAGGHGTAWVAGTVRARSLTWRRLGAGAARRLAASGSLPDATAALAATPYRHGVRAGQDLAGAQRGVTLTMLWHLRVLAGWLPREGGRMLRLLAGRFEIANVDDLLEQMAGGQAEEPLPLGALATMRARPLPRRAAGDAGDLAVGRPRRRDRPGGAARHATVLGGAAVPGAPGRAVGGRGGRAAGGARTVRGRPGTPCHATRPGDPAAGTGRAGRHLPCRAAAAPAQPRRVGPGRGRGPRGPVAGRGGLVVPGGTGQFRA